MKTLYVSDLDGTLLNKESQLSPYTRDVLTSLVKEGLSFTYATARSLVSSSKVSEGLKLTLPVIVYNGAFIMDQSTNEILYSTFFETDVIEKLKAELLKFSIDPLVYSFVDGVERLSWNEKDRNEGINFYIQNRQGDKRLHPLNQNDNLFQGNIFYMTCIGTYEDLKPLYERIEHSVEWRCTFQQEIYRKEYWLEIMPKEATKAKAIEVMKSMFGFDRVITFGDAINDIPMFSISDECYAVENAVPLLKEKATSIISSNEDDGVVKWLLDHPE